MSLFRRLFPPPSKHPRWVRQATDGSGNAYRFDRPVSAQKAFNLVMDAKRRGLPPGSTIRVSE